MKRKIVILLTALMCVSLLAACRNNSKQPNSVTESEMAGTESDTYTASESQVSEVESDTDSVLGEESADESHSDDRMIYVTIGEVTLTARLDENTSSDALLEKLSTGDITVDMRDYGQFEKVGPLGFELPRNDEQYTTKAGDIILYQGNSIVFYYATNSWNFTKLGEFQNVTQEELMEVFGEGSLTARISINE